MKFNDVKICVVGGGNWGKNHLNTLDKIGNLGGLVDENQALTKIYKKKFPYLKIFRDIDHALEEKIFQGFVVATPAKTHYELSKKILNSGCNLLVEKPFCETLRQAKSLANLALKKDLCLMVGHLLLFHGAIRKIKDIIDKKVLGKVKYIYINRVNLGKVRDFEDVFWSLGPHDVSIINYLIDQAPSKINSTSHSFLQKGISDIQITNLIFGNDLKAHIFNSWYNPYKEHRVVVIGSRGMVDFRDDKKSYLRLYKINAEKKDFGISNNSKNFKSVSFKKSMPLEEELKYFIKNIREEKQAIISGPKSAVEVTKIMSQL
tara:strand:+ start:3933 stop:4886 length:954 start_codon:yes stop_codon:yes gene_type:complete